MELSPIHNDALREIINIGVGKAAHILSQMIKAKVSLLVPKVSALSPELARQELAKLAPGRVAAVRLAYGGRFSGTGLLCFTPESAAKLANVLVGEEMSVPDLDALKMGAITEVGNILLNGVIGSTSNILGEHVRYSVPVYEEGSANQLLGASLSSQAEVVVIAETSLTVEALAVRGDTVLLLEATSFGILLEAIDKMLTRLAGQDQA